MICTSRVISSVYLHLQEVGQPTETLGVSSALHNRAHVSLNGADTVSNLSILSGGINTKSLLELGLGHGTGLVNLVSENEERDLGELISGQKFVKFLTRLLETGLVGTVDEEDNSLDGGEVALPQSTGTLVTTEIMSLEADLSDHELLKLRTAGGLMGDQLIVTEHMKEGSLTGIVETEEQDTSLLVDETEGVKDAVEPVEDKHIVKERNEFNSGNYRGKEGGIKKKKKREKGKRGDTRVTV